MAIFPSLSPLSLKLLAPHYRCSPSPTADTYHLSILAGLAM